MEQSKDSISDYSTESIQDDVVNVKGTSAEKGDLYDLYGQRKKESDDCNQMTFSDFMKIPREENA